MLRADLREVVDGRSKIVATRKMGAACQPTDAREAAVLFCSSKQRRLRMRFDTWCQTLPTDTCLPAERCPGAGVSRAER